MNFTELCLVFDDIPLDKFANGASIVLKLNAALAPYVITIPISATGTDLVRMYSSWSDEVKLNIQAANVISYDDYLALCREAKSIKAFTQIARENDNQTKANFITVISIVFTIFVLLMTFRHIGVLDQLSPSDTKSILAFIKEVVLIIVDVYKESDTSSNVPASELLDNIW